MAVSTFMAYALGALGPFMTDDLDLSRTAFGSLTTMLFAVGAALSPVAGPLVDHFGGRRSLLVLFATGAAGTLVTAGAPNFTALLAGVAVTGLSVAMGNPATNQLLAVHVPVRRRGTLTGIKQSGVQAGAFLAGAGLPGLAEAVGWRPALASSTLLAALGAAGAVVSVPRRRPSGIPEPPRRRDPSRARLDPAVNRLAVYALLMGLGVGATGAYLPLYAVEELGFSRAVAGLPAGLIGLIGIVARVGWGRRQDRSTTPVARSLTTLAAGSVTAGGLLWAAGTTGVALLWAGAIVFGATATAWNALGMLAIVRDVDVSLAGRASGRVLAGFYAGFVAGPISFGAAVDAVGGYAAGWAGITAAFVAAAVVAARWHRSPLPAA